MTNQTGGNTTEQKVAAERIEEARQLNRNIVQTLRAVLELVEAGDFKDIELLPRQMAQLTNVFADSRKREAEFEGKFGNELAQGEIDFDALRRDIGCRLDRLRTCCKK